MTAGKAGADRTALARTIAVVNGKGGVGKTSVVSSLAGLYAAAGYKVLAVDLDPQGNLAEDLGYVGKAIDDQGAALLAAVPTGAAPVPVTGVRDRLDVLVGGEHMHDLAAVLLSRRQRDTSAITTFAASLSLIASSYDVVLIDCPPGSDVLQEAALVAARWVLVPTRTDTSSRKGLREVGRRFAAARELNPDLELLGVVLFGVTSSASRVRDAAREAIRSDLGGSAPVLQSWIRYAEAAANDARARGQLAHELEAAVLAEPAWYLKLRDPSLRGERLASSAPTLAADYQAVAGEVLDLLTTREQDTQEAEALA